MLVICMPTKQTLTLRDSNSRKKNYDVYSYCNILYYQTLSFIEANKTFQLTQNNHY